MQAHLPQTKRSLKAIKELSSYAFARVAAGIRVTNLRTGSKYLTTKHGCTCPDWENRCQGEEMFCKHQEMVRLTPFGKDW